jgi:two-component system LytT family sensor kinase
MDKTEKSISVYSSLLIALLMSVTKLLAARDSVVVRYWHYDQVEIAFQFLLMFGFCYLLFKLQLDTHSQLYKLREQRKFIRYIS